MQKRRLLQTKANYRLDAPTETGMNQLLLAWLGKNQLINKDGIVYEATASGDIKQQDGKQVMANPDVLRQQILDEKTGLAAYIQQNNKEIELTLYSHDYAASQVTPGASADKG